MPGLRDHGGLGVPVLREIMGKLLRRFHVVLAVPVVMLGLGYGAMQLVEPRYTSEVQLLIEPRSPGALGAEAQFALIMVDHNKVTGLLSILESATLLRRVVRAEGLAAVPEFAARRPGLFETARALVFGGDDAGEQEEPAAAMEQRAIANLQNALRVTRVGTTYVLRVAVTARSAELAQRLADAVTTAYLTDQLEAKLESARRASEWTSRRTAEIRSALLAAENEAEAIRRRFNLIEVDRGTNSFLGRQAITEVNQQLIQAGTDVREREARLEQARRVQRGLGSIEAIPEVVSSSVIGNLRAQQGDVMRRLSELQQRFGSRHPDLARIEEERRSVDRQLAAEVARIVQTLQNEYEIAVRRRDAFRQQLEGVTAREGGEVDQAGLVALREAERVAQAYRQLYDGILAQARQTEQQETLQQVEGRVISPAVAPAGPSFPTPLVFLLLPGLLGLPVGMALALLLDRLDARFINAHEVEELIGVPVLASVPVLEVPGGSRADRFPIVQHVWDNSLGRYAEALRSVRTGLVLTNVDRPPRIIQLTSAVPGEGKSTLAASLAVSASRAGLKTIIVDADFRNPTVAKNFNVKAEPGLADVLAGEAGLEEACVICPITGITVLPAGMRRSVPPDLAGSKRLRALFDGLVAKYELVIIDGPPTLSMADARMLNTLSDAVLLVVEWKSTPAELVEECAALLRGGRANLAGVLLNKVDFRRMARYGYGYGRYGAYNGRYSQYYRATEKYFAR